MFRQDVRAPIRAPAPVTTIAITTDNCILGFRPCIGHQQQLLDLLDIYLWRDFRLFANCYLQN